MPFSQLITPTSIPAQWTLAVDSGRVPQAVLLNGTSGSELLPLALKLVTYLQCSNRQEPDSVQTQAASHHAPIGESCGTCESCRSMAKLSHPDVHFTFPVAGTGLTSADLLTKWREEVALNPYLEHSDWLRAQTKDNKQGNINRDEVLRILHHISMQRFTHGHKVVLIWGAEYLGDEANRLLKAIEEPPEKTLILLLTTRVERILPTITSRCRIYRLPSPPTSGIASLLQKRGLTEAQATSLAYAADANISRAILSAQNLQNADESLQLASWLRNCFAGKGAAIIKSAAALAALGREEQKHFLLNALRFARELGVVLAGTPKPLRLDQADREVANKLGSLISWSQLTALTDELNHLLAAVERNANGKIAFTASSIRIHHILARQQSAQKPLRRAS